VRKAALVAHVCTSVGWFGAVVVFLALAAVAWGSRDEAVVRAGYVAMDVAAWYAIVPLAVSSLATGLLSSLGTAWGLVRHWWVLVKLVLTVVATVVLLAQLAPIDFLTAAAAGGDVACAQCSSIGLSLVVHAVGGLLVLLATAVLAVYKPRGVTRYGWRRTTEAKAR
jgi:hypothetical protein